ncbi:hypothetical protein VTK26DRAFT_4102 [Humicola hyalothermophila]
MHVMCGARGPRGWGDAVLEEHFKELKAMINDDAVLRYVYKFAGNGFKCRIKHAASLETALMGNTHYCAAIFLYDNDDDDDDYKANNSWHRPLLLRVRLDARLRDPEVDAKGDREMLNEYATLKFLETTTVPAPRVYGIGLRTRGSRGAGARGWGKRSRRTRRSDTRRLGSWANSPTSWPSWPGTRSRLPGRYGVSHRQYRTPAAAEKAGGGSRPDAAGPGSVISVTAQLSDRLHVLDPAGPFRTAVDYYTAHAEQYLKLIADGQLHCFYPIDAYLLYRFLKDDVWQLVQPLDGEEEEEEERFYLKHNNDWGTHVLIDDDYNLTGIIDWQLARVVPRREAFGPSFVTFEIDSMNPAPKSSLSARDLMLAEALDKRGSSDLARLMRDEKARRFFLGLGWLDPMWKDGLWDAVLDAFEVRNITWAEWREKAIKEYSKTDARFRRLLRRVDGRRSAYHLRDLGGSQGEKKPPVS